MTEDEAKTKECRVGGLLPAVRGSANGMMWLGESVWAQCSGSGCMHWRWSEGARATRNVSMSGSGDGDRMIVTKETRTVRPEERNGFCGLAGKPAS